MAAYGGFFIPKSYGTSITMTGGPEAALYVFIVFYLLCIAVTWWFYAARTRRCRAEYAPPSNACMPDSTASLAHTGSRSAG